VIIGGSETEIPRSLLKAFLALSRAARKVMKDTENQLEAVQYQQF
jgi:hypothetical protein